MIKSFICINVDDHKVGIGRMTAENLVSNAQGVVGYAGYTFTVCCYFSDREDG